MNVGIFTDTFSPDINGVTTSVNTVRNGLIRHGQDVFIVAPNNRFRYGTDPAERVWRLPSVPFYGERRFRFVFPVSFHQADIFRLPLEIVHTQTPFPVGALGYILAKSKGLPLIHTYHTRYQEYGHYLHLPVRMLRAISKTGMNSILRFVGGHDAVIAPSSSIKRELESFGIHKPIHIIPTGIDIERAERLSLGNDSSNILRPFGISSQDEYLIFASRLGKEKNISFILDAMRIIATKKPSLKLVIVGDGDVKRSLTAYAARIGLRNRVVFTGFLSHEALFPLYRRARVMLFSSLTETQGLVILEAMALGVPVVALRATGVEDALAGDQGGFLIEPGSYETFAAKVIALVDNNGLRAQKSEEAQVRAAEFSIETTTKNLIALYESVRLAKSK